jgi:hypothetical protein
MPYFSFFEINRKGNTSAHLSGKGLTGKAIQLLFDYFNFVPVLKHKEELNSFASGKSDY